ncbi:hypothetical protein CP533_6773 [Ophiocordyceps camponoti-saundersi (nom. inval.)]|nr:hypothetical protein CP533_6773 [Ophiocordyceps camponoti-saundersi (nom. inval.)]
MSSPQLISLFLLALATVSVAVEPEAIYGAKKSVKPEAVYGASGSGNSSILRIGNGGAGQSGLIEALANAYIEHQAKTKGKTLQVAWYKSDTTQSIKLLETDDVDVCITYNTAAEDLAIKEGIAMSPSYYAFNDHFLLVGPKSNPAKVEAESADALGAFARINMEAEKKGDPPVRFLSRYDASATNIKESLLFASIGQVPWTNNASTLYQRYEAFPIQALTMAMEMNAYTLTDRGTLLSVNQTVREQVVIYSKGTDNEDDVLLNPAHLLIGAKGNNQEMSKAFAEWLVDEKGQSVIAGFEKNGEKLYTRAPTKK